MIAFKMFGAQIIISRILTLTIAHIPEQNSKEFS